MQIQHENKRHFSSRNTAALLLLPLLLLMAACDEDSDNPIGPVEPQVVVSPYDTTGQQINGKPVIVVKETSAKEGIAIITDGVADNDITWSSDYTYVMQGRVFVNDGQTLTIEPGTVVRGAASDDPTNASVLIVARGGKLIADGTAEEPIIFTAEEDDITSTSDLAGLRGLWGGVIVLGRAPTNNAGDVNIEGIPTTETRGAFGGNNPADNSGIIRYVSIRHGGTAIGANNEINGLTLGAVGNGTIIDYVEVFNNEDDGFEWFGGTVDAKHLVAAFVGDDSFDMDHGYSGRGQFFFAIQAQEPAGRGGELDGADGNNGAQGEASTPYATPVVYNATYIGSGMTGGTGDEALGMFDNFAGSYFNSIFIDFPDKAVFIEDSESEPQDSRARFEEGTLKIENNIFFGFGAGNTFRDIVLNEGAFGDAVATYLEANNRLIDPKLGGIAREAAGLDPVPAADSPAATGAAIVPSDFYDNVSYIGAFEPGGANWAEGWTFISQAGWLE